MNFIAMNAGASEEKIKDVEEKIDRLLPSDYRNFLRDYNGGKPEKISCFNIQWSGQPWAEDEGILDFLYTTEKVPNLSWHGAYWGLVEADQRIPKDTIPIGYDPFSNQLLLGIYGSNRGKIFFWAREYECIEDDIEPGYENVGYVANSFHEFFDSLYDCSVTYG